MPAQLIKPTEGTAADTCILADSWSNQHLETHLQDPNCACKDRTGACALQCANNRKEKRKMSAGESRAAAALDDFNKSWSGIPKTKTA